MRFANKTDRQDNEAVASGPSSSEIPCLPLESFASLFS